MVSFKALKKVSLAISSLAALATSVSSFATVEALTKVTIVNEDYQSGDLCFLKVPAYAEYGIGGLPESYLSVGSIQIPRSASAGPSLVEANKIVTSGGLTLSFIDVNYDTGSIPTFEFQIDMSPANGSNGPSVAGRTTTLQAAKLGLLAITQNMQELYGTDGYRVFIDFVNLPVQSGLSGSTLNASTSWPYTSSSPLIATYKAEMINTTGSCR